MRITVYKTHSPRSIATRPTGRSTPRRRWIWPVSTTGACRDLFTINYTGVITPKFFLEGRYSQRNLTFVGSGSTFTDIRRARCCGSAGRRYNAPTFCGVCTDEERDNQDISSRARTFCPPAEPARTTS
jgi:hypothetical protein